MEEPTLAWAMAEFMGAGVEDKREAKSLVKIGAKVLQNPELSLSGSCGKHLRKAAHRIFSKQDTDVSWGHQKQTVARCQSCELVLVLQDSTDLDYHTHPSTTGLGQLGGGRKQKEGRRGLGVHTGLCVNGKGIPLGILEQLIWAPTVGEHPKKERCYPLEEKESYRWVEMMQEVNAHLRHVPQVLVIGDRENDFYEYFAQERLANVDFLVRVLHTKRKVFFEGKGYELAQVPLQQTTRTTLEVVKTPTQDKRIAQMELSWGKILCPLASERKGKDLDLFMVVIKEIDPADAEQALCWYLITSMAVETAQQALDMVNYYRMRWIIERLHLVMKDGLKIERLQCDNFTRLKNAIELYSIVAWQLLMIKYIAQKEENTPLEVVFEQHQVELLQNMSNKEVLNVKQAILIIAGLAGFFPTKKQSNPGEKTIWKGLMMFNQMTIGFQIAKQKFYGTG